MGGVRAWFGRLARSHARRSLVALACVVAVGSVELVAAAPTAPAATSDGSSSVGVKDPGHLPVSSGPAAIDPVTPTGSFVNLPPKPVDGRPPRPKPRTVDAVPLDARNVNAGAPGV